MAYFDPETGCLSLQVVYDGAPLSGKTSSILALGRLLDREVVIPEEREGRTIYFDWLDYEGGRCRGRPIRCRVIAVPGQQELARRRETILRGADVVVFVADSSAAHFDETLAHFADLRAQLSSRSHSVPILLQLNKRDVDDGVPREQAARSLDASLPLVETVATDDAGVREAFVLAIGEAVRDLRDSRRLYSAGLLDTQEIQVPDPEQLRELLEHA